MTRYTPFEEMDRMVEQMRDRMWNLDSPVEFGSRRLIGEMSMRLIERDDEVVLVADLPGFQKDEIDVTFADDALTVAARHDDVGDGFDRSRTVSERVALPAAVTEDAITATYRNGVLEVHLPIAEDGREQDKQIEIEN